MAKSNYWLMKSEPSTYSIDDLKREKKTPWTGVRNFRARNFMRDEMSEGDLVLFYHSSAEPPGIAGVAKVASKPYADPTQFDKKNDHTYEPKATKDEPYWFLVDIGFVEKLAELVPLEDLRANEKLDGMPLLQRGQRLSVQPVSKAHFAEVLRMGKAKTKA